MMTNCVFFAHFFSSLYTYAELAVFVPKKVKIGQHRLSYQSMKNEDNLLAHPPYIRLNNLFLILKMSKINNKKRYKIHIKNKLQKKRLITTRIIVRAGGNEIRVLYIFT